MKNRGFGLVEVLIALLIIGVAVVGFSRLMLANIRSVSYDNTQQLTSNATQYIVDKINANLQLNDQNATAQNYAEANYNDDATVASALCNNGVYCTSLQQARSNVVYCISQFPTSTMYSCDLSSQCTNSPLTIHSAVSDMQSFTFYYLYIQKDIYI